MPPFTGQEDDDETGLYNYNARLYDPELGRFISADSIVPEPGSLQAFNRYSYCANNPLIYVDPSGHVFGIDDLVVALVVTAAVGAASGATAAAINGGSIGTAAVTGAITALGVYLGGVPGGALAGVVNASITGDDIGEGALWGAIGAVTGITAGYGIGQLNIGNPYAEFAASMAAGGLAGGGISALAGGDFVQGFQNGAIGAAAGYFAGMGINRILRQSPANVSPQQVSEKAAVDMQVAYETPEDMYGRVELANSGEGEWHFDSSDHGNKPHFQRKVSGRELRYDAKTLEPIPHKGTTPPQLSKSAMKTLMKSQAWKIGTRFLQRFGSGFGLFFLPYDPANIDPMTGCKIYDIN